MGDVKFGVFFPSYLARTKPALQGKFGGFRDQG